MDAIRFTRRTLEVTLVQFLPMGSVENAPLWSGDGGRGTPAERVNRTSYYVMRFTHAATSTASGAFAPICGVLTSELPAGRTYTNGPKS